MKSRFIIVAAVVIACAVAFSTVSMARGFGDGPPRMEDRHFRGPMKDHRGTDMMLLKTMLELKLTDEQQTQGLAILDTYRAKKQTAREALAKARDNFRSVMQDEFDEQKVREAHRALSSARGDLLIIREKRDSELKALLTADQLKLLSDRRLSGRLPMRDRMKCRPMPRGERGITPLSH